MFGATNALGDNPKRNARRHAETTRKVATPVRVAARCTKEFSSYDRYYGGTSFSYDLRLGLKTFTGKIFCSPVCVRATWAPTPSVVLVYGRRA